VQSRVIRARLHGEAEGNVALEVADIDGSESVEVAGRGELQIGVLLETMRREGFEVQVARPRVLFKEDPETGEKLEPIEEITVDVDEDFSGVVIEKLALRKSDMQEMRPLPGGKVRLVFHGPARGLIGYLGEFLTDTRGTGVLHRQFLGYEPFRGPIEGRRNGVLIANSDGQAAAYALWNLEERGQMFITSGEQVYQGMIVGENARSDDLDVNVLKGKKLTNIRAAGKDEAVQLTPPKKLSLEEAIAYIEDDELVELTPSAVRLRKRYRIPHERKRYATG
jgi:GTP-binding protein